MDRTHRPGSEIFWYVCCSWCSSYDTLLQVRSLWYSHDLKGTHMQMLALLRHTLKFFFAVCVGWLWWWRPAADSWEPGHAGMRASRACMPKNRAHSFPTRFCLLLAHMHTPRHFFSYTDITLRRSFFQYSLRWIKYDAFWHSWLQNHKCTFLRTLTENDSYAIHGCCSFQY